MEAPEAAAAVDMAAADTPTAEGTTPTEATTMALAAAMMIVLPTPQMGKHEYQAPEGPRIQQLLLPQFVLNIR